MFKYFKCSVIILAFSISSTTLNAARTAGRDFSEEALVFFKGLHGMYHNSWCMSAWYEPNPTIVKTQQETMSKVYINTLKEAIRGRISMGESETSFFKLADLIEAGGTGDFTDEIRKERGPVKNPFKTDIASGIRDFLREMENLRLHREIERLRGALAARGSGAAGPGGAASGGGGGDDGSDGGDGGDGSGVRRGADAGDPTKVKES